MIPRAAQRSPLHRQNSENKMDQRKILQQKIKEFEIREFIDSQLGSVGLASTKLVPTPLGDKIIISASRPGLVVGRKGQSIKKLTQTLKKRFNLENPQIEISEVENVNLDAQIGFGPISSLPIPSTQSPHRRKAHKALR